MARRNGECRTVPADRAPARSPPPSASSSTRPYTATPGTKPHTPLSSHPILSRDAGGACGQLTNSRTLDIISGFGFLSMGLRGSATRCSSMCRELLYRTNSGRRSRSAALSVAAQAAAIADAGRAPNTRAWQASRTLPPPDMTCGQFAARMALKLPGLTELDLGPRSRHILLFHAIYLCPKNLKPRGRWTVIDGGFPPPCRRPGMLLMINLLF